MVVEGSLQDEASSSIKNEKKHRLKQRFDVREKLGQGTYGKVQLAVNRESGQEVAIKTIKKSKIESEQDLIRIRREIQIMSSIQHPHIIHIYEVFENKDKIVLVMQFASGGELYDYLSEKKVLSDLEARRIFRQIAAAVYYCHKNKICHRDLKLENILLDEKGNAKIADFGLSNVFDERHMLKTYCGSPLYASPEIVKGVPYYGPEVDCWSMGVLLYTLVYGAMPFDGSNFKKLVTQISEGDYFEPKKKSKASDLIRRLLTVNPVKRATIVDICTDYWVNQGYEHSLLQVAEDMANLTPVRLDLLLALAPESPCPSGEEDLPEEELGQSCEKEVDTQKPGAEIKESGREAEENEEEEEEEEEEDDDEVDDDEEDGEENKESAADSFAFVRGSQISNFTASTPDLQRPFDSGDNSDYYDDDDNSEFLPPIPVGQSTKRGAEKSFDGSLPRVSSTAHKDKKPRKSNSSVKNSRTEVQNTSVSKCNLSEQKQMSKVKDINANEESTSVEDFRNETSSHPLSKKDSECSIKREKENSSKDSGVMNKVNESGNIQVIEDKSSDAIPDEQRSRRTGRAPGKIVIPKTFESPQSTPLPKSQGLRNSPVSAPQEEHAEINKSKPESPKVSDISAEPCMQKSSGPQDRQPNNEAASPQPSVKEPCPNQVTEEKKIIAKGILKKGIARARLAERRLSQQSSTESEVATPPTSSVKSPEAVPSFYKTPKPYIKEDDQQMKSKAEIVLSSSGKRSESLKSSSADHSAPLWNNAPSCQQQKQPQNVNASWGAVSSSLDSEMSGWREQVEESLRRLSPDGSTEKSLSPVNNLTRCDEEKPLVPIARSYKKFTFTKDGACITETKKVYATPGADGSWTKVEKKTKITTRPGNAEEFERFRDLHMRNSSPLTKSDSQSSSGSNDVYDDIFDSWTGDTMMCNMMKIRDMFQKFSRDSFFHSGKRRHPFRHFYRTESNQSDRRKSKHELRSGYSTDKESSDVDDDYNADFSGSNPVMYGSQGLWQFLRPPSRLRSSRRLMSSQPEHVSFARSTSHDRSESKLSGWKQCESRASSGYNTGSRSQSRDRTQSPREKVLRFIFESPSKEFSESSLSKKASWCFKKGSQRRDSGVNSDGYESEHSYQGGNSDRLSKCGRYSPGSTVCSSSREDMIRDFVKTWPKEAFMHPSLCKEILNEVADSRRHKVEEWLHMNDAGDDDFPFDMHSDSRSRMSSRKSGVCDNVPSPYATVRPREYVRYIRSSSDKVTSKDIDRFPSFGETSHGISYEDAAQKTRSRVTIHSPVSEESGKGCYSPQNTDSSHSSTPVHQINFTFSDGRAAGQSSSHRRIQSFDKSLDDAVVSNAGSIRVQQSSAGRNNPLPVVQMRVSFNRGGKESKVFQVIPQSPPSSVGLWQQKDQPDSPKTLITSGQTSDRESSPLPGIKKFSTEMVHTVGSTPECMTASENNKRLSIGPSIECEVKATVKNSSGGSQKGKIHRKSPSIWCEASSLNACTEPCMGGNAKITNLNTQSYCSHSQTEQDSEAGVKDSKGANTPDSLEDPSADCSACSEETPTSFSYITEGDAPVAPNDLRLDIKPLGVLWSSYGHNKLKESEGAKENSESFGAGGSEQNYSNNCSCTSDKLYCNGNCSAVGRQQIRGRSFTAIGSIWEQRNNNSRFRDAGTLSDSVLDNCGSVGLSTGIEETGIRDFKQFRDHSQLYNFKSRISPLTVLSRLPVSDSEEGEGAKEVTGVLPSFMDELQSPKQVLHQALRICESLKSCE